MDQIDIAIHFSVHESPIPTKEIASRIGMSHQTLINKANPNSEFHKLCVREAIAIMRVTGSTRILESMALEVGNAQVVSTATKQPKGNILMTTLAAAREHGDVMRAVETALTDNRFTSRERETCHLEIDEAIDALVALRKAVTDHV